MQIRERLAKSGKRFYCVCFSIRSGSTLLCHDLAQWGLGFPTEYFQLPDRPVFGSSFSDYLVDLVQQAPGEWFAFKVAWQQLYQITTQLRSEGDTSVEFDLRTVFPDLSYLQIVRKDKIEQAVSAWRALRSNIWHRPTGTDVDPGRPEYDFDAIKLLLFQLITEDWLWQSHFHEMGIQPLVVNYEDYEADRVTHLAKASTFLHAGTAPAKLQDQLGIMRDEWTESIVNRVRADLCAPRKPIWALPGNATENS